jgi:7-cyano-7-deazaguanine synthase
VFAISALAKDRGRDGGRTEVYELGDCTGVLGNWRATPTTEAMQGREQPYDRVVHNGTIANDRELGNPPGHIDSEVIGKVLDRTNVHTVAASLAKLKGSYALAIAGNDTIFLAANYKPLYYYLRGGTVYFSSMERHLEMVVNEGHRACKLQPYSVLDLRTWERAHLTRRFGKRALVVASAGLDSTVVAAKMQHDGFDVTLLHYRYGCKAGGPEQEAIKRIAQRMEVPLVFLDLDFSKFTGGSPLFGGAEISSGVAGSEYAHEWVPARNLVMLANAVAYAEANNHDVIALGNNLEESGAYPDNEEEFTHLLDGVLDYAVQEGRQVRLVAPVGHLMKHEIVRLGVDINAPLDLTWSCYKDGDKHCGECGPCFMRRTAFERNGLTDPVFG